VKIIKVDFTCLDLKANAFKISKQLIVSLVNKEDPNQNFDEDGEVMENYCRVKAAEVI